MHTHTHTYIHTTIYRSVNAIPASASVAQKFALPLSVVIHPLNDSPDAEQVCTKYVCMHVCMYACECV